VVEDQGARPRNRFVAIKCRTLPVQLVNGVCDICVRGLLSAHHWVHHWVKKPHFSLLVNHDAAALQGRRIGEGGVVRRSELVVVDDDVAAADLAVDGREQESVIALAVNRAGRFENPRRSVRRW